MRFLHSTQRLIIWFFGIWLIGQTCQADHLRAQIRVTQFHISLIQPGTVIAKEAPRPWTHLIVKSQPRVGAGDIGAVPRGNNELAGMFFTGLLARVEGGEGQSYRLADVAGGIGTRIGGRDTIVSPTTYSQLGAKLGIFGPILLRELHKKQQSVQVVLRSPTTAVFDTPIVVRSSNRNRPFVLRYAVLVDSNSGQLDTLAWLIETDAEGRYLRVASNVQWLPRNKLEDCVLHVDAGEYFVGIPSENAYAVVHIPQGQLQIELPGDGAALLIPPRWTKEQAPKVDEYLRDLVRFAHASWPAPNRSRR